MVVGDDDLEPELALRKKVLAKIDAITKSLDGWDYDARSDELLRLYSKGKKEQWDAETRIDWSLAVDPEDPMQMAEEVGFRVEHLISDASTVPAGSRFLPRAAAMILRRR